MTPAPHQSEVLQALQQLRSEQLLQRLAELESEEQQVRAALRVVRARERAERVAGREVSRAR